MEDKMQVASPTHTKGVLFQVSSDEWLPAKVTKIRPKLEKLQDTEADQLHCHTEAVCKSRYQVPNTACITLPIL